MKSAYDDDASFAALMDDMQTLYRLKAGETVSQEQVDALLRLDAHYREEDERSTDAFHLGWQAGLERGGGTDIQTLQNKLDEARGAYAVAKGMRKFEMQRGFRRGAQACREMLARFIDQGGDRNTAASVRANWHPGWGDDPGKPEEVAKSWSEPEDEADQSRSSPDAAQVPEDAPGRPE